MIIFVIIGMYINYCLYFIDREIICISCIIIKFILFKLYNKMFFLVVYVGVNVFVVRILGNLKCMIMIYKKW